jgi:hypothetical protein
MQISIRETRSRLPNSTPPTAEALARAYHESGATDPMIEVL